MLSGTRSCSGSGVVGLVRDATQVWTPVGASFGIIPPTPSSIMPPKAKPSGVKVNAKPMVLKTERIALNDISVEEDSGWRELDEERVSELSQSFREYGVGNKMQSEGVYE